jgi:serine O-acetyltransferase
MKHRLIGFIRSDVKAKCQWLYGEITWKNLIKTLFTDGTFAMIVYRFMQASNRAKLAPFAMLFNKINVIFGRCIIGRKADFGHAFVLIHSYGVVINTQVRGGNNIFLEHDVTIGAEKGKAPVLGNNIFIGAGARVIGGIQIGDNVKIGANAVVLEDVPSGATVAGVPARIVKMETADSVSDNANN